MRIFGLDIGGTAIKWGIEENDRICDTGTLPSHAGEGADALLRAVFSLLDSHSFDLVGISTAGIVASDGSIYYANENIPNYTGVPLSALVWERYGKPCYVLNDIAAAAYSERGAADDYYYIAIGTGVGGIYVKDGDIMAGACGIAGQIGYLPSISGGGVDFDASSRGLAAKSNCPLPELFARAKDGDESAERIITGWAKEVSSVIMSAVGFINPSEIVIGGGVSEQGEELLRHIRYWVSRDFPEPYRDSFKLRTARGGNYAAVRGIIEYVKEKIKK